MKTMICAWFLSAAALMAGACVGSGAADDRTVPDGPVDACVPAQCAPRACGPIDDGCGNQLCCTGGCHGKICQPEEP